MIRLKDEEIRAVEWDFIIHPEDVAKAQLKKVVEWLAKKSYPEEEGQEFWISDEEWQVLLEEVK